MQDLSSDNQKENKNKILPINKLKGLFIGKLENLIHFNENIHSAATTATPAPKEKPEPEIIYPAEITRVWHRSGNSACQKTLIRSTIKLIDKRCQLLE